MEEITRFLKRYRKGEWTQLLKLDLTALWEKRMVLPPEQQNLKKHPSLVLFDMVMVNFTHLLEHQQMLTRLLKAKDRTPMQEAMLANYYLRGQYIAIDYQKALEHLELAIQAKCPWAFLLRGNLHLEFPEEQPAAYICFSQAIQLGHWGGYAQQALCYLEGTGVPRDPEKARVRIQQLLSKGGSIAYYLLGRYYQETKQVQKMMDIFAEGAQKGDPECLKFLLTYYRQCLEEITPPSLRQLRDYHRLSYRLGKIQHLTHQLQIPSYLHLEVARLKEELFQMDQRKKKGKKIKKKKYRTTREKLQEQLQELGRQCDPLGLEELIKYLTLQKEGEQVLKWVRLGAELLHPEITPMYIEWLVKGYRIGSCVIRAQPSLASMYQRKLSAVGDYRSIPEWIPWYEQGYLTKKICVETMGRLLLDCETEKVTSLPDGHPVHPAESCLVCMQEDDVLVTLSPCGHQIGFRCAHLETCPICRTGIDTVHGTAPPRPTFTLSQANFWRWWYRNQAKLPEIDLEAEEAVEV